MSDWALAFTAEQLTERRERARLWAQTNRAQKRENDRAWRRRHPEKVAAKNAVAHALRVGTLARGVCEVCGAPQTHAHHDDYSRKLDVRWLCVRHHAEADVERRRREAAGPGGGPDPATADASDPADAFLSTD